MMFQIILLNCERFRFIQWWRQAKCVKKMIAHPNWSNDKTNKNDINNNNNNNDDDEDEDDDNGMTDEIYSIFKHVIKCQSSQVHLKLIAYIFFGL